MSPAKRFVHDVRAAVGQVSKSATVRQTSKICTRRLNAISIRRYQVSQRWKWKGVLGHVAQYRHYATLTLFWRAYLLPTNHTQSMQEGKVVRALVPKQIRPKLELRRSEVAAGHK